MARTPLPPACLEISVAGTTEVWPELAALGWHARVRRLPLLSPCPSEAMGWQLIDPTAESPFLDAARAGTPCFHAPSGQLRRLQFYVVGGTPGVLPALLRLTAERELSDVERARLLPFCPCLRCAARRAGGSVPVGDCPASAHARRLGLHMPWSNAAHADPHAVGCLATPRSADPHAHPDYARHIDEAEAAYASVFRS
jgi:hypothetical protein